MEENMQTETDMDVDIHINVAKDIKGVPDKEYYKQNYGKPYRIMRWCCVPGIVYYIVGIILFRTAGIVIPGAGNLMTGWLVSVWATGSIAGIPILFFVQHHSFSRLKKDYMIFSKNYFLWHKNFLHEKLGDELITKDEEYKVVELSGKSQETRGYFKIRGVIEKTEIRNGKRLKPEIMSNISIPKAFSHMDEIYKYPVAEEKYKDYLKAHMEKQNRSKGKVKRTWQEIKNL